MTKVPFEVIKEQEPFKYNEWTYIKIPVIDYNKRKTNAVELSTRIGCFFQDDIFVMPINKEE